MPNIITGSRKLTIIVKLADRTISDNRTHGLIHELNSSNIRILSMIVPDLVQSLVRLLEGLSGSPFDGTLPSRVVETVLATWSTMKIDLPKVKGISQPMSQSAIICLRDGLYLGLLTMTMRPFSPAQPIALWRYSYAP